ncbi:succinate dehydrogenase, hydrophobic membrane anchor protein [Dokdonella sp.]|uniref:succinate dehydrogenase, hydrophobic membrane anchor protein n=1 Tax=Dokdonella sp. TaxID=2291710 RepID=UPI003526F926
MSQSDKYRHPIKNARGLGSAKDGVHHFMVQRVTAVALLALCVYVVYLLVSLIGSDYQAARAAVAHPCNATLLVAFLVAMFWHGQLGMQVVIEDYVHTPWLALTSQLVVKFVCALAALASIFAVVRIALGA